MRTETEQVLTAAQVVMHDRIAVTTWDGQRVEGRPNGAPWAWDESPPRPMLSVDTDDGDVVAVPLSDIDSITPLATPDPLEILEEVAHALRRPTETPLGMVWYTAIAGPHEILEISVALRRVECLPTSPPPSARHDAEMRQSDTA